ncbi:NHL repeat-containing protein [Kordiimonas pumila]|uniref:Regulatory protein FlaEY n=1 Tax=Kordiimonas pumila TaxID=2161677 RepID=A0ABV7D3I5_9PROT|nr:hypothetical protein [Kordiimonas pumila]
MAFFGTSVSFSSLFGVAGQQSSRTQIIGFDSSLISASVSAKLTQSSLRSLSAEDRAAYSIDLNANTVVPPWQQAEETSSLEARVRSVRELTKFIDLNDDILNSVKGNSDKTATFALYRALENLRVLAEYASADTTSKSSLDRLNAKFQEGFDQVRDYISTAELDKLSLFLGEKKYTTEAAVRTGKNGTGFDGSLVVDNPNEAIAGLTGTEVFTITLEKGGESDEVTVDLSTLSGALSLNNIVAHINEQIESVTALDDEGEEYVKYQTRFDIHRDGTSGRYGLQVDGTITEEVSFAAAVSEPTLYVTSSVSQLDDDYAITSRISEFNNLSGTLTLDDTTSFAAIDLEGTDIKERTKDIEEDDVDPAIAALRDKFRAEALESVTDDDDDDDEEDTDNTSSITNIDSDYKVNADTSASRIAVTSDGGIYVVGTSDGTFGHQINTASEQDVFLTKFDSEGNLVFSRLLGVSESAEAYGITVDSEDNVIIVGKTESALSTADAVSSENGDAFITKISKRGDEVFRYQLDTFAESGAYSVAVDSNDDIYVGGYTKSAISSSSGFSGGSDALILKLNGSTGKLTDSNVFGTSGNDVIRGIAVDANNNLVVAVEEGDNAVVYRVDGSDLTNHTSSVNLGNLGTSGSIQSITIDNANGAVYIAGVTTNASLNAGGAATLNETALGGQEGFVSGLTLSGTTDIAANFTTYLSTSGTDKIADVVVQDGVVYVAGSTTQTLAGETARGATDGFVARVDGSSGALGDVQQFGESLSRSNVTGIAFTNKGNSVLETLGLPTGAINADQTLDIESQTSAREGDFFYISIDGGTKKKITLEDGDTFDDIARKLKITGIGKIKVEVTSTSEGDKLKISTVDNGVAIDLLPGTGGRDLLERLGLEAGKLLPKNEVFDLNSDDDDEADSLGGVYGLKLDGELHIKDKTTAKYVLGLLDDAISTIQRAFRSLEYNPFRDLSNNSSKQGTVPQYLQNQIANFQSGLARLQSGSSSSVNFFV